MPGLTPASGSVLAEAAAVCLENQRHLPGVTIEVEGDKSHACKLAWRLASDQQRRSHRDPRTATELGACGVAILMIHSMTGDVVVERSWIGSGFDYWLGADDEVFFQRNARLEVSGIRRGRRHDVVARARKKIRQVENVASSLPVYIAVIEFSMPLARIVLLR